MDREGTFQYVASYSSDRNLSADGDDPEERKKLILGEKGETYRSQLLNRQEGM